MFDKIVQTFSAFVTAAIGALFAAVFITLGVVSQCEAPARDPIPRTFAEARLAEEEAVATTLGFVREHEEELRGSGPFVHALTVERGECVAVLAGFFGGSTPSSMAIVPSGGTRERPRSADALAAHLRIDGLVGHVEWCADRHVELEVVIRVLATGDSEPQVIVRLLRAIASVGLTNERLVRGWVLFDPTMVLGPLDAGPPDAGPGDAGLDAGPPDAGARRRTRRSAP